MNDFNVCGSWFWLPTKISFHDNFESPSFLVQQVLFAVGRDADTRGLCLEKAGVKFNERSVNSV